jgi:hypothetical protein
MDKTLLHSPFQNVIFTLKGAREVNITFEHCSVYPKIVTGKVQIAYFENIFSDWSIFKEAVLLSFQKTYGLGKVKLKIKWPGRLEKAQI